MKKLHRSKDSVIGGVLGGFAEYVEMDPTLIRLIYILITLITPFPGIIFYVIAWIVIPKKHIHNPREHHVGTEPVEQKSNEPEATVN